MKKTLLITWWLGYIWSHWVVAFEQAWFKTVIVDNLSNSSIDVLNWIEKIIGYKPDYFKVDLRDEVNLEKIFTNYKFDWVIHFAWLKSVFESCSKTNEYFDNNVKWSIVLFWLMKKYNVLNIIFSSSATVYREIDINELKLKNWYREDDLTWDCTNPYWTTKFLIEQILKDLSKYSSFNSIILRYFNPIWAHISWYIWENPVWVPNNLLPYIMKVANWELPYLNIFWNDYDTVDWTWIRDYIDVNDLISWHILAYNRLLSNDNWYYDVFNLWTWKWYSVLEILNISKEVVWKDIKHFFTSRRDWDLAIVYCNTKKANTELWFCTKFTLKESLLNSWMFYNKKLN